MIPGIMNMNTIIITPDNILFHCIDITGSDTPNWRKGLDRAMKSEGLLVADIKGPIYKELGPNVEDYVNRESYKETGKVFDFVVSNGKKYVLSDCEIDMISGDRPVYEKAVKKLKAIALARIEIAPLKIPIIYISSRSNKENPSNPGSLILFKILVIQFTIGILSIFFFIDELIKQL